MSRYKNPMMQGMYDKLLVLAEDQNSEMYHEGAPRRGAGHRAAFWDGFSGKFTLTGPKRSAHVVPGTLSAACFMAGREFARRQHAQEKVFPSAVAAVAPNPPSLFPPLQYASQERFCTPVSDLLMLAQARGPYSSNDEAVITRAMAALVQLHEHLKPASELIDDFVSWGPVDGVLNAAEREVRMLDKPDPALNAKLLKELQESIDKLFFDLCGAPAARERANAAIKAQHAVLQAFVDSAVTDAWVRGSYVSDETEARMSQVRRMLHATYVDASAS